MIVLASTLAGGVAAACAKAGPAASARLNASGAAPAFRKLDMLCFIVDPREDSRGDTGRAPS